MKLFKVSSLERPRPEPQNHPEPPRTNQKHPETTRNHLEPTRMYPAPEPPGTAQKRYLGSDLQALLGKKVYAIFINSIFTQVDMIANGKTQGCASRAEVTCGESSGCSSPVPAGPLGPVGPPHQQQAVSRCCPKRCVSEFKALPGEKTWTGRTFKCLNVSELT